MTNEIDVHNAYFMVDNAINRILSNKAVKEYTIIGYGAMNIFVQTADGEYYRICYRAYEPDVLERMVKTYNLIRKDDYGFLVPLEANITDDYVYYKVRLLTEPAGKISYDELHGLFSKVLKLGADGLAWADYHSRNIRRLNGELKIIDFDCWDQIDVVHIMRGTLKKLGLTGDTKELTKWAYDRTIIGGLINPHVIAVVFSLIHGYTDPLNFMRLRLNLDLFQAKYGVHRYCYNIAVYNFLMDSPFDLL